MKNNEKFTEKAEGAIEQARLAAFSLGHSCCLAYCAYRTDSAHGYCAIGG